MIRPSTGFLSLVFACLATVAAAHPAPFSFLDLRLGADAVTGSLTVHDLDAAYELKIEQADVLLDPEVARRHGPTLAGILARRLRLRVDGRDVPVTLTYDGPVPDRQGLRFAVTLGAQGGAGRVDVEAVVFPYDANHQTFVNVYDGDALRQQAILDAGHSSFTYYAGSWQGAGAVLATFVPAGAYHIAIGPDHLLFLLGLLLLGGSLRRLALVVTAFTIGHTVTLSLAALGIVTPPGHLVEPLIALSVVLVGVDNLLVGAGGAGTGRDLRPWMAGLFGLVHGFGFASVLQEFGLPQAALGWSLFGFNVGVELGQLAFVLPVAALLAALRRRSALAGNRLAMVGSMVVAAAGTYWFIARVFFPGGWQ